MACDAHPDERAWLRQPSGLASGGEAAGELGLAGEAAVAAFLVDADRALEQAR